jgi:hypothetical protein
MSETDSATQHPAGPGGVLARRDGDDIEQYRSEFDFAAAATWLRRNYVLTAGLVLVVAEVIWKALFLSHMYFSQDDFVNLDIAIKSPLDWRYLSLIGAGHLFPGVRALTWVLARVSLYDWGLDAGVALLLVAAASLALLRLLRILFGDRPAILIPLAVYALTPLTVPDLGWWWCAIESLPLQLAIFMTLAAHVHYVRTGRNVHLVAAASWLAIGMLFFEKGFILAPLMFAITAGFLTGARSWLTGAAVALRTYARAWLVYGALMVGYAVMFFVAFSSSAQQAQAPTSASAVLSVGSTLIRDTFVTGAFGGPWHWLPLPDGQQALAQPPSFIVLLCGVATIALLAVSVLLRPLALRAWAILLGWVVIADVLPLVIGRLSGGLQGFLGLETRYLADAACVLAICVGLAFLPVIGSTEVEAASHPRRTPTAAQRLRVVLAADQNLRYAGAVLVAVFVVSSIWSVHAYQASTPGSAAARTYVTNIKKAVRVVPRGTTVLDQFMPQQLVEGLFGKPYALESSVIGDLEQGKLAGKVDWVSNTKGTIDDLRVFGSDGELYPAVIEGVYSVNRTGTGFKGCWPARKGHVVVRFQRTTGIYDWTLRLTYIWGSAPSTLSVHYGGLVRQLAVKKGVHNAYLPVNGQVTKFVVSGFGATGLCVTGAESGIIVPFGPAIP